MTTLTTCCTPQGNTEGACVARWVHQSELCACAGRIVKEVPGLWKADIDSAFRRLPLTPSERKLMTIVFMLDGQVEHMVESGTLRCIHVVLCRRGRRYITQRPSEQLGAFGLGSA